MSQRTILQWFEQKDRKNRIFSYVDFFLLLFGNFPVEFQIRSITPDFNFQPHSKSLISRLRCIWLELELISAGNRTELPCSNAAFKERQNDHIYEMRTHECHSAVVITCRKLWIHFESVTFRVGVMSAPCGEKNKNKFATFKFSKRYIINECFFNKAHFGPVYVLLVLVHLSKLHSKYILLCIYLFTSIKKSIKSSANYHLL